MLITRLELMKTSILMKQLLSDEQQHVPYQCRSERAVVEVVVVKVRKKHVIYKMTLI